MTGRTLITILAAGLIGLAGCGQPSAVPATAASAPATGPAPRLDDWRVLGMGGGGTTRMVKVSPHDPDLMVAQSDMTCAFVSENGGASWRMFNLLDGVNALAFDAADPAVIYAGNQALWRSADRGRTWSMVFPAPAAVKDLVWVTDDAECHLRTDDPLYPGSWRRITAILAGPGGKLLAAWDGDPPAVLAGADRGVTWRSLPLKEFKAGGVIGMFAHPGRYNEGIVAVIVRAGGVYAESAKRTVRNPGPAGLALTAADAAPDPLTGELVLYAATPVTWKDGVMQGGLYVTRDYGST
ncbi:MAG: hypothetical protein ABIF71_07935 [Planctomycetota bacterium]